MNSLLKTITGPETSLRSTGLRGQLEFQIQLFKGTISTIMLKHQKQAHHYA